MTEKIHRLNKPSHIRFVNSRKTSHSINWEKRFSNILTDYRNRKIFNGTNKNQKVIINLKNVEEQEAKTLKGSNMDAAYPLCTVINVLKKL